MGWKVYYFQTARGENPVKEFIQQQDEATYAKILQLILLLQNNGPFFKPPYAKKLQDKLYELRTSGKIAIRILYTIYNSEYYVLHAFIKKSDKTPSNELELGIDRMKKII